MTPETPPGPPAWISITSPATMPLSRGSVVHSSLLCMMSPASASRPWYEIRACTHSMPSMKKASSSKKCTPISISSKPAGRPLPTSRTLIRLPMRPARTHSLAMRSAGVKRNWWLTASCTPAAVHACIMRSALSRSSASGFSHSTWVPAAAAAHATSACSGACVHTLTTSSDSRVNISR